MNRLFFAALLFLPLSAIAAPSVSTHGLCYESGDSDLSPSCSITTPAGTNVKLLVSIVYDRYTAGHDTTSVSYGSATLENSFKEQSTAVDTESHNDVYVFRNLPAGSNTLSVTFNNDSTRASHIYYVFVADAGDVTNANTGHTAATYNPQLSITTTGNNSELLCFIGGDNQVPRDMQAIAPATMLTSATEGINEGFGSVSHYVGHLSAATPGSYTCQMELDVTWYNSVAWSVVAVEVEEASVGPAVNNASASIDEDESTGSNGNVVYNYDCSPGNGDLDLASAACSYSESSDVCGIFGINGSTGVVTRTAPIDYEATTSCDLVVDVTSPNGSAQSTLTVSINDINDESPVVSSCNVSISPTTLYIMDLAARTSDADLGDTHTYNLQTGNGISISTDGKVDRTGSLSPGTVNFTARVTDAGGNEITQPCALTVVSATSLVSLDFEQDYSSGAPAGGQPVGTFPASNTIGTGNWLNTTTTQAKNGDQSLAVDLNGPNGIGNECIYDTGLTGGTAYALTGTADASDTTSLRYVDSEGRDLVAEMNGGTIERLYLSTDYKYAEFDVVAIENENATNDALVLALASNTASGRETLQTNDTVSINADCPNGVRRRDNNEAIHIWGGLSNLGYGETLVKGYHFYIPSSATHPTVTMKLSYQDGIELNYRPGSQSLEVNANNIGGTAAMFVGSVTLDEWCYVEMVMTTESSQDAGDGLFQAYFGCGDTRAYEPSLNLQTADYHKEGDVGFWGATQRNGQTLMGNYQSFSDSSGIGVYFDDYFMHTGARLGQGVIAASSGGSNDQPSFNGFMLPLFRSSAL